MKSNNIHGLAEEFMSKQLRYGQKIRPKHRFLINEFATFLSSKLDLPLQSLDVPDNNTDTHKIAFITEDVGHLTGGRYYAWLIVMALTELGYDITVYTNQKPVFREDLKDYQQPKVEVICRSAKELESIDVKADIYIGSPISGDIAAARLGKKYGKPAFALIFDPFPMMEKYLGKKNYALWNGIIEMLRTTDTNIISLCKETSKYIYEWLNKRPDQVFEVYPSINSREKAKAPKGDRGDYIVFISRLVKHKKFEHVLKAAKENNIRLKVISSVDGINAKDLVRDMDMSRNVDFHYSCTDVEKFEIIKNSRAVINGAIFEGFGMWMIEAIACGIPVVCYDYPTFREIAEFSKADNIYFAKWNSPKSLREQLKLALRDEKFRPESKIFDFEALQERIKTIMTVEPKIGVITIALNESKYIGASLTSVIKHPNIEKVAVIEGAVNLFSHAATTDGLSLDKTGEEVLNIQRSHPNGKKIIFERHGWASDKAELRNRALTLLGKDITHVLVVDADEVWKQEDLDRLVEAMRNKPRAGIFLFKFYHFWKQPNLRAVGGQWDVNLFRCFNFSDKSLHWDRHEMPVVDKYGRSLHRNSKSIILEDVYVYHYGYMKDEKDVIAKLDYYSKRDTQLNVNKDIYLKWEKGKETQPTHGGGTVEEFTGTHPEEVKQII